ncbi:MAG: polyprenyl synthetase family protein [Pseudomonadota bacterium]
MYLNDMNTVKALEQLAFPGPSPILVWAQPLRDALERQLQQLNEGSTLGAIAEDLFEAGGKRLRGLMAMNMAQALRLPGEHALCLARVVELAHGATLLHDDVIDEAALRRGRPAARVRWCNTLSVLAGDYVLLRALRAVEELATPGLMSLFLETLDEVIAAEALQHVQAEQGSTDLDGYLAIAEGKTGSLFGFACAAPALVAGSAPRSEVLGRAGRHAGIAFQILDDLRDVVAGDPTKQGLQDAFDGVLSLPLRLAAWQHPELARALHRARRGQLATERVQGLVQRHVNGEILARTRTIGLDYLEQSAVVLRSYPQLGMANPLRALHDWIRGAFDALSPASGAVKSRWAPLPEQHPGA